MDDDGRILARLGEARGAIDATFGEGHAAAHPELVAACLHVAAIDDAVRAGRAAHAETLDLLARLSRETNETILRLKPRLFG